MLEKYRETIFFPRYFSLVDAKSFTALRNSLEVLLSMQPSVTALTSKSILLLELLLAEYKEELLERNAPIVVRDRLEKISEAAGVAQPSLALECARSLHIAKRLLLVEEDDFLKRFVVLDPIWLAKALAKLSTPAAPLLQSGLLVDAEVPTAFADFPVALQKMLVKYAEHLHFALVPPVGRRASTINALQLSPAASSAVLSLPDLEGVEAPIRLVLERLPAVKPALADVVFPLFPTTPVFHFDRNFDFSVLPSSTNPNLPLEVFTSPFQTSGSESSRTSFAVPPLLHSGPSDSCSR